MKAPSFRNLTATSAVASRTMAANRSKNTRCEVLLCRELRKLGLQFRQNAATLPGKPDVVFQEARLAVFCDGDFWHGRNWKVRRQKLARGANSAYWVAKIETNVRRDRKHRVSLQRTAWRVLRLWESDILLDPRLCATRVGVRLTDCPPRVPQTSRSR